MPRVWAVHMAATVAHALLNRYLGEYLDLSRTTIKIGFFSHEITATNVILKHGALAALLLPVDCCGVVKSLRVSLPLLSLGAKPVEIELSGVYCSASAKAGFSGGRPADAPLIEAAAPGETAAESAVGEEPPAPAPQGTVARLLTWTLRKMADNICVTLRDVTIKVVEICEATTPPLRLTADLTCERVFLESTDSAWRPTLRPREVGQPFTMYKRTGVEGLAVRLSVGSVRQPVAAPNNGGVEGGALVPTRSDLLLQTDLSVQATLDFQPDSAFMPERIEVGVVLCGRAPGAEGQGCAYTPASRHHGPPSLGALPIALELTHEQLLAVLFIAENIGANAGGGGQASALAPLAASADEATPAAPSAGAAESSQLPSLSVSVGIAPVRLFLTQHDGGGDGIGDGDGDGDGDGAATTALVLTGLAGEVNMTPDGSVELGVRLASLSLSCVTSADGVVDVVGRDSPFTPPAAAAAAIDADEEAGAEAAVENGEPPLFEVRVELSEEECSVSGRLRPLRAALVRPVLGRLAGLLGKRLPVCVGDGAAAFSPQAPTLPVTAAVPPPAPQERRLRVSFALESVRALVPVRCEDGAPCFEVSILGVDVVVADVLESEAKQRSASNAHSAANAAHLSVRSKIGLISARCRPWELCCRRGDGVDPGADAADAGFDAACGGGGGGPLVLHCADAQIDLILRSGAAERCEHNFVACPYDTSYTHGHAPRVARPAFNDVAGVTLLVNLPLLALKPSTDELSHAFWLIGHWFLSPTYYDYDWDQTTDYDDSAPVNTVLLGPHQWRGFDLVIRTPASLHTRRRTFGANPTLQSSLVVDIYQALRS